MCSIQCHVINHTNSELIYHLYYGSMYKCLTKQVDDFTIENPIWERATQQTIVNCFKVKTEHSHSVRSGPNSLLIANSNRWSFWRLLICYGSYSRLQCLLPTRLYYTKELIEFVLFSLIYPLLVHVKRIIIEIFLLK